MSLTKSKLKFLHFKRGFPKIYGIFQENSSELAENSSTLAKNLDKSDDILARISIFLENFSSAIQNCEKILEDRFLDLEFSKIVETIKFCDLALLKGVCLQESMLLAITDLADLLHGLLDFSGQISPDNYQSVQNQKLHPDITLSLGLTEKELKSVENISPSEIEMEENDSGIYDLSSKFAQSPKKITQLIDHWPAISTWNFQFLLENYAFRSTFIEIGEKYTDDTWKQEIMTLAEYFDLIFKQSQVENLELAKYSKFYLAQNNLLNQLPKLKEDLEIPDFILNLNSNPEINCWFGPTGTISPKHKDPQHNLYCQISGIKMFKLGFFEDNNQNQDFTWFSILYPGDCLFVPKNCYHEVIGIKCGFGVNFWF